MKRNRFIFAGLWILSLIGISIYGGPVTFGFFTLMTMIPLVSLLYLILVYFFFRIYQSLNSHVLVVNRPVPFYFKLCNEYFLNYAGVRVRFYTDFSTIAGLSDETEYELPPKTEVKKETMLVCKYRGEYETGIKTVEIRDFLRLFCIRYKNRESLRVTVKPQTVVLDRLLNVDMNRVMRETKDSASVPDVLARAYVQGDDIRQIHWNLSAKTGTLMTRERVGEEKQGIGIVLDTSRDEKEEKVFLPMENKQLEVVLALSYFLCSRNMPVQEFHFAGEPVCNHVENVSGYDDYYEKISAIRFDSGYSQEKLMETLQQNLKWLDFQAVFFVMSKWSDSAMHLISRLLENRVYVVVYLIGGKVPEVADENTDSRLCFIPMGPEDEVKGVVG